MSAVLASIAGCGGTVVSPAPSRADRSRVEDVPTRRVGLDPPAPRAEPMAVEASRLEARDTVDGAESTPAGAPVAAVRAETRPAETPIAETPVAETRRAEDEPVGAGSVLGAGSPGIPQTSQ